MNVGVIVLMLFESELFGYKKGVFIDVKEDCLGWFEIVEGGILFLDEIVMLSFEL